MKDILVFNDEKSWKFSLISAIKKALPGDEVNLVHIDPRLSGVNAVVQNLTDFIIISPTIPQKNIIELFKLLANHPNRTAHIFIISEDFERFSEVVKAGSFPHLHPLSSPVDFSELAKLIHTIIYPIRKGTEAEVILEFLKTFVDSTKYVFKHSCMLTDITHQKPLLLNKSNTKHYDLEGSIHLQSDYFEGYFFISFSKEVYFKILEKVLGETYTEINASNIDFAAELVNMIYGQAKVHLNESGHNFQKVIPKYTPYPKLHISDYPIFLIPINTDIGIIDIKVEVIKKL